MSLQYIDPSAVDSLRAKHPNLLMIDVRDPGDHARLHMPHSFCVPLAELENDGFIEEHGADKNRPILLICQLGKRATTAARSLEARLDNPLFVLAGGLDACLDAGVELIHGAA